MLASPHASDDASPLRHALLLVAHGTRDDAGREECLALARHVAQLAPELAVELCFLELASPLLADALRRLARDGIRQVTVAPLLLFAAGHAKRDVPEAIAAVLADFPRLTCRQAPHLGCHDKILALSAQRFREAIAARAPLDAGQTLLLLVGRGSLDEEATREMLRFSRLRAQSTPVGRVETCFLAMARPSLADTLPRAASLGFRRIVVQPHLLFAGDLLAGLVHEVGLMASGDPGATWIIAPHLGPSELLARAVLEIASAANG